MKNFIKDLRALVPKLWKQGRTPEQRGIDCLKFNFTRSAPMLTDYVTGMWPGGDEGLDPDVMEFIRVREGGPENLPSWVAIRAGCRIRISNGHRISCPDVIPPSRMQTRP